MSLGMTTKVLRDERVVEDQVTVYFYFNMMLIQSKFKGTQENI